MCKIKSKHCGLRKIYQVYKQEHFPSFAKLVTIGATAVATHTHWLGQQESTSSFWKQDMGVITHSVTSAFTRLGFGFFFTLEESQSNFLTV